VAAAFPLSAFRRTQVILEVRFDEAYLLWDRAGAIWSVIARQFKAIKHTGVAPNQATFFGDDRFAMAVALDRASITDHRPQGSLDRTFDVFAAFIENVAGGLNLPAFTRVGNRYLHAIDCKSMEDARRKAQAMFPSAAPQKKLFTLDASSIAPALKIEGDDGELGCTAQVYPNEQKIDFTPPPDVAAMGVEKTQKTLYQLVFDIDFYTKKSVKVESFEPKAWLMGWQKTISRDADAFLSLGEERQ